MRISVILPHRDDGYWQYVEEGIYAGAAAYAGKVDVKTYFPQLNYNVGQMTELVKRQIAARVDVLIVQGNEDEDFRRALLGAIQNKIQVILIDTDMELPEHYLYIGTNNYEAGIKMGEQLALLTDGKVKAAVISGEPAYANLQERYEGLLHVAEQYPGIQIVRKEYDQFDSLTFIEKYKQICSLSPEVDALICLEGTGGQALNSFVSPSDKHFSYVLTFDIAEDTIKGLKNGIINGTMVQDTHQMGYSAVEEAMRYAESGSYSKEKIYTEAEYVTNMELEALTYE